ncbi:putative bifunctional diguanylate cyclase/phosphodiesterase [Actinocrispum wychmicini]|uniref:PAS domain S-box-containing protein/diguanylate cyclase (GGDEF)-like protein n=1 Tax=Actinocrispum wychmicini TaxID=1213861 RepID=A0A4R2K7I9_9PSEU|nr:EAL domain-containing protein [Actinocrispum wychmicini]TCO65919.1 PAS domain S-box-containing protein/diguanylate cyclase (GGDEF)-like protein [Actinocrispum wychmicini]
MPEPSHEPRPVAARDRLILARKWAYVLHGAAFLPLSQEELETELAELLDAVCSTVSESSDRAGAAGAKLIELGCSGDGALPCTMDTLGKGLLGLPEFQPVERFAERIVLGLGQFASGYAEANRRNTFDQQESMKLSLLKAVRDAQWNLRASEARFDEVVMSTANGILITDLDGNLLRVNGAIADILDYEPHELTALTLFELVHPDYAPILREDYQALLDGRKERVKQPQRLLRKDGDIARITLTASVLRGDDDQPTHFVTVVEDGTELMLLQSELNRQALHDVLTGLPNRQYFSTYIEGALRRAGSRYGVTLFHLDLDSFAMICNGLGRRAGDHLLVTVAQRLKAVVSGETAMVARFDGDEFGILVENTADTPGVAKIVADINRELAEPTYVDNRGVAVSASIGVVHRPAPELDPTELLRAADFTLRRAKAAGRGQWELFHADQDLQDRRTYTLAAEMPGAWENGQVTVCYRPVVGLADRQVAGVEAMLRWDHPRLGVLGHDVCVELAELTGLILPLGEWALHVASGQVAWWRQRLDLPLVVGLTVHQTSDADLVARVVRAVEDPAVLTLGVPVGALRTPETMDNVRVLTDMGIRTVLDDYGTAPGELTLIEDLPVRSVRLSRRLVERQATAATDAPLASALMTVVPLVQLAGATVIVDGVKSRGQADWWRSTGADLAMGDLYGAAVPPGDFTAKFIS